MDIKFARSVVATLTATLSLYGCATASKDLTATYVSPMQYQSYDCDQIAAEIQRISARVNQLGGRLDEAANNDKGIAAVGIILFWPVLFALGGTKQQEAEYSRLKGEYDALEQQAIMKKCTRAAPASTTATASATAPAQPPAASTMAVTANEGSSGAAPGPSAASNGGSPASTNSPPNIAAAGPTSKYMFNAERHAKAGGCESPVATLNIATATYETFTIVCSKGEPLSVRCDNGNCRTLQ